MKEEFFATQKYLKFKLKYYRGKFLSSKFLKIHIKNQVKSGASIIQIFDSWAGLVEKKNISKYIYDHNNKCHTLHEIRIRKKEKENENINTI